MVELVPATDELVFAVSPLADDSSLRDEVELEGVELATEGEFVREESVVAGVMSSSARVVGLLLVDRPALFSVAAKS